MGAKSVSSYLKFGDNSKVYSVAGNGETFLLPSPLTSDQNVTFGFTDSNTDWLSIKLYSGGSSCSSGIPAPSVTANPNNIYQGQSSTLTATCSTGTPEWQTLGSGASKSVSPSTTTTYNAKCVSNGISSSWASTTVTVDPNNGGGGFSISSMTITTNCPYTSGKGITFTPSGGSGQYQYMLQNDGTWKETSVALQWHPNWALSFNLKIRDKLNTSDIASYTVNVNQCGQAGSWSSDGGAPSVNPPTVTANPNNIYQGQSSTLTATCSSGAPEWQTLGSGASKSVSPSTTTTYNAKCVSNGISSSWASTTVTVDPNNGSGGVSISSMTITTNCPYPSGKGINFTPSGGSGQYQYMLQNDGTWKETSVALQWHPNWALSFNLKIRDKLNTSDIASYTVNVNQCGQAGSWSSDGGGLRIGTLQLNTTEEKSETLILYPSPVSDELNVQINSKDSFSVLKLTNTKGALLREFRITDNTMKIVDLNFLIPGVYFILVENKKKRFIKRFVKE